MSIYSSNSLADAKVYRFHSARYMPHVRENLYEWLLDSKHLATQQARFAGANLNPGFYFSLTPEACIYEMLFYQRTVLPKDLVRPTVKDVLQRLKMAGAERVFLTCEASCEDILNVLWPETLWKVLHQCFPTMPAVPTHVDTGAILLKLASAEMGGKVLTDIIGRYAYSEFLNGVKFPSARAIEGDRNRPWSAGSLRAGLKQMAIGDETFEFDDIMQEIHTRAANVVIFRGTYAVQSIRRFRFESADDGVTDWIDNQLFGAPIDAIEQKMLEIGGLDDAGMYELCDNIIVNPRIDFH
jgi:RES domain